VACGVAGFGPAHRFLDWMSANSGRPAVACGKRASSVPIAPFRGVMATALLPEVLGGLGATTSMILVRLFLQTQNWASCYNDAVFYLSAE